MKKIKDNEPVFGLSVKFAEGVDYSDSEGTIIQIELNTRNTSVPMIVTARDSEAKTQGTDGIFALCSEKCGKKMKETVTKELTTFKEFKDISLN
ncbi:hypothetical protein MUO14_16865 [Halobacillus shinanisalinarum]|uniref:ATP-grasp domain-containing protein n=1 Tax=Halobacillus shinanisalinarum TaxID=2932258 RepID=A0ABY4GW15_9BACI|nr:hypothetical protein [Halobacillus shinanisalinarum]UOQ92151.1 hypothetical protein MUO14_16865 [Halobacillus shinanisalinarum]